MLMSILLWLGFTAGGIVAFAGLILLMAPRQKDTGFIDWSQL